MFSKAIVAVGALATLAAAQAPNFDVSNGTPNTIYYELVGPGTTIGSGTISSGSSVTVDSGVSISMKMDFTGTFTSPYQFEFNYNSTQAVTYYDFSAVNGDPFTAYSRTISPSDTSCKTESCAAGDSSNDCEYTTPSNYGASGCAQQGGYISVSIG